jgi:hypothetical protein
MLNQKQPLDNERFHTQIEKMRGIRREAKARGRPRFGSDMGNAALEGQQALGL